MPVDRQDFQSCRDPVLGNDFLGKKMILI